MWLGRYDGDATVHHADTRKELIARFKQQVDSDQLPLPEIDALFERWTASIKEMAPRVGLHAAMKEIMTLQSHMSMAQTMMRSQALLVEQQIAALRAKCSAGVEPAPLLS